MIDFLNNIDSQIYLFFNGMHHPLMDTFMTLFTGRFVWIPLYLALAGLLLKGFGVKLGSLYILAIGAAILLTDQTCATVLRPMFERLRPSNPENPLSQFAILVNDYRGGRYGFPSCHSANSFALATFVCCLIKRPKIQAFMIFWAILNSYTRLYLGVHYPGDLLAGGIIGAAFGYLSYRVAVRFYPEKRVEALHGLGRPMLTLPTGSRFHGDVPSQAGITIGDIMIGVGVATMTIILLYSALSF